MASPLRQNLHETIEQLTEEQLVAVAAAIQKIQTPDRRPVLKEVAGFRLPAHWPPQFPDFEPLPYEGEPPSEQLIRERR